MLAYLSRRLLLAGFTTIVISMLAFFVMEVPPGDAATKFVDLLMSAGDTSSMEHAETFYHSDEYKKGLKYLNVEVADRFLNIAEGLD